MKRKIYLSIILLLNIFYALAQPAPAPYGAIPSARQLAWHGVELYGLIHFTPTTFQNKEWGYGDADPQLFNPKAFDAAQIVLAAKAAGLKALILVAKHHDGFALWPTQTTDYNIRKSPYENGKGDMVKAFELAARKYGLQFGIYCSPWDRHDARYGTEAYLKVYQEQLRELYSNYGPLFMSWHDGANGGSGYYGGANTTRSIDNSNYYQWENTWNITRSMQPMANIFSDVGWDVRWVGNERGIAADTSWSTFTPKPALGKNKAVPGQAYYPENPSGTRNGDFWMPAECDVPLRKGWFYHPQEQPKTPEQLFDLYLSSVGRGAALDLGLAPNTQGLLAPEDVNALAGFGKLLQNSFKTNLMRAAKLKASSSRGPAYSVNQLKSSNTDRYWASPDELHEASITLNWIKNQRFDLISLGEYIPLGQRIDSYKIEALVNGKWQLLAQGSSIGPKRIVQLKEKVQSKSLRVYIKAPVALTLQHLGVYNKASLDSEGLLRF